MLKQVHMFLTSFRLAIGHSHTTASCKGLFSLSHLSSASWQNNRHRELPHRGPEGHSWSACSSLSFLTFAISYAPAMDQMQPCCNSAEAKQQKEHTTTLMYLFKIRWINNRVTKKRVSTRTPLPWKGLVTAPGFSSSLLHPLLFQQTMNSTIWYGKLPLPPPPQPYPISPKEGACPTALLFLRSQHTARPWTASSTAPLHAPPSLRPQDLEMITCLLDGSISRVAGLMLCMIKNVSNHIFWILQIKHSKCSGKTYQ